MAKTINDELERTDSAFEHDIFGSFPFSTVNVNASLTFTIAATDSLTLTSDTAGVTTYEAALTADGNAKASYTFATTHYTSEVEAHTGGTAGNSIKVNLIPHTHTGAGVLISENASNVTIMFEDTVSTGADVDTALGSCTLLDVKTAAGGAVALTAAADTVYSASLANGTAATYVSWAATAPHLTMHFTDGVSTITAMKTAVNTTHASKVMTLSSAGGVHTFATADAFASTALTGGVAAVALDTSLIKGNGFSVARTGASGTGEYTVTFTELWKGMKFARASIQQHSNTAYSVQVGNYTAASKTVVLRCVNYSGAVDPAPGSNQAIHFAFTMLTQ